VKSSTTTAVCSSFAAAGDAVPESKRRMIARVIGMR
jgi:hypothetical protein